MRILVFANPIAGRGRGKDLAARLVRELQQRGHSPQLILSKADSANLADPFAADAAIVMGGDGTLRGVAQWAIEAYAPLAADPASPCPPWPILIVPMGTANLMGQHLGIKWNEARLGEEVDRALRAGRTAKLDVARTEGGIFLLVAGVGFDAWVIHELDRVRRGPIHITDYFPPAVRAATVYQFPELQVELDGKVIFPRAPGLAIIGNVREYGTGFPVLPDARPDDGALDVCVMPCSTRLQLVRLFLAAAAGEHTKQEGVVYAKGRHIRIDSPHPVPVQADGEPAGTTPVHIDLLPGPITFIVPPNTHE